MLRIYGPDKGLNLTLCTAEALTDPQHGAVEKATVHPQHQQIFGTLTY